MSRSGTRFSCLIHQQTLSLLPKGRLSRSLRGLSKLGALETRTHKGKDPKTHAEGRSTGGVRSGVETGEQEQGTLRPHSDTPRAQEGPKAWDKLHQSKPSVTASPACPRPRGPVPGSQREPDPPRPHTWPVLGGVFALSPNYRPGIACGGTWRFDAPRIYISTQIPMQSWRRHGRNT